MTTTAPALETRFMDLLERQREIAELADDADQAIDSCIRALRAYQFARSQVNAGADIDYGNLAMLTLVLEQIIRAGY